LVSGQPLARIDLGALARNYREVVRLVGSSVRVLAMVKADAYGHGDSRVAAKLESCGCRDFGVTTLDEAQAVRGATRDARIVVFGGLLPPDAERVVDLDVEVATQEPDLIAALAVAAERAGRQARIHIKVDTGMRRFGVEPERAGWLAGLCSKTTSVRAVGLCSHFAMAESVTTEVTAGQVDKLEAAARLLESACHGRDEGDGRYGRYGIVRHIANSAAIMTLPRAHLDMVRPGLMLYGLYPDAELAGRAALEPVMTLDAPVVRIAEVGPGEGIGYGHSYRTRRRSRIATLRCGYADGYPRALSNQGVVLLRGRRVPVIGRICMDHTIVDASDLDGVDLGDRAILWGHGLDAGEVATLAGTISYELVARVGARVRREYVDDPSR